MGEVYYINETKAEKMKRVVKEKMNQAINWVGAHGSEVLTYGTGAIAMISAVNRVVRWVKPSAIDRHDKKVARTYYDPSTGMHWDLRRKATNADRSEIVRRKRNGEYAEDILKDLKLIR